jgi:hypothetical protein
MRGAKVERAGTTVKPIKMAGIRLCREKPPAGFAPPGEKSRTNPAPPPSSGSLVPPPPRFSFTAALGIAGCLALATAGCVAPTNLNLPLHPFASTDQNDPIVEKADASPPPVLLSRDMSPLHEFGRQHMADTWEATAQVDFIVDEHGVPRQVFATAASDPRYGEALAIAVSRWRYNPGMKAGKLVRVHLQVVMSGSGHPTSPPTVGVERQLDDTVP